MPCIQCNLRKIKNADKNTPKNKGLTSLSAITLYINKHTKKTFNICTILRANNLLFPWHVDIGQITHKTYVLYFDYLILTVRIHIMV